MAQGFKTGGRQKGTPNRMSKALKDMILGALEARGGQKYLELQADKNPVAFLNLLGKVLPTTLQGDRDNPLKMNLTQQQLAEQTRREIAEAFREWRPHEREEHPIWPTGQLIEQRSALAQDDDRSQPVAEADRRALPIPREFAAPGSPEVVPTVVSLPASRYRPPRRVRSGRAG